MIYHRQAVIIAHRGACGYLPEHTLAAKALAFAMGADFLEQDVVASRDEELVVLHDVHLDRVSNVRDVYPDRAREDGRYYVRDFDMAELRALTVWERFDENGHRIYPGRYPARRGGFRIHSLREELQLVAHLNDAIGTGTGIYPEIKRPAWHKAEGVDLSSALLDVLGEFGYVDRSSAAFVQCFDAAELHRLRHELHCNLPLVQLIAQNDWGESDTDDEAMWSDEGLRAVADVADGIGPWACALYEIGDAGPLSNGRAERARQLGLEVHPFTFRCDDLPEGFEDFFALIRYFVHELGVTGVFTDFPDIAKQALGDNPPERETINN